MHAIPGRTCPSSAANWRARAVQHFLRRARITRPRSSAAFRPTSPRPLWPGDWKISARTARAFHRQDQGLQAQEVWPGPTGAAPRATTMPAHLRHGVDQREGSHRITCSAWKKREARPPQDGRELDLFHMQEEAPARCFWHPKGWSIFAHACGLHARRTGKGGFQEVNAPEIMGCRPVAAVGRPGKFGENMVPDAHPDDTALCDQHDELSGPTCRLQMLMPSAAIATCRCGSRSSARSSLRTVWRVAWPDARAPRSHSRTPRNIFITPTRSPLNPWP